MIYDKTRALEPGYYENFELCYKPALEKDRKDMERYRNALSHILWVKDCGIDGTNEQGIFVNFASDERDLMYDTAAQALQGWVPERTTEPLLVAPPVTKGKAKLKYIPAPNVTCNGHIVILEHTEHLSGSWDKTCPACIANAKLNKVADDYDLTSNDTRRGD